MSRENWLRSIAHQLRPRPTRRAPRILLQELEDRTNPVAFGYALDIGGGSDDAGRAVTTDGAGYAYVTGNFSGTVDFDPSAVVTNLTSDGGSDGYVAKYTPAGALVWAKALGGDGAAGIALDGQGNVYTVGTLFGQGDFDPSAGVYTLIGNGAWDAYVSKLDSSGNFVWAKALGGTAEDFGTGIAVDFAGTVVVTGYFRGTGDFDPGAGAYNLTSAGGDDAFAAKLDAAGNFRWAKRWGGATHDRAYGVTLDAQGNAVTTGYFTGTADLDPGPGVQNRTAAYTDGYVSKLDPDGNLLWASPLGQTGNTVSVVGTAVAVDGAGNVYTTGEFNGTADFDPSPGTFTLTNVGYENPFVSKLDAAGHFVWAKSVAGSSLEHSGGAGIAVDVGGNIYTTGYFSGTIDADPTAGTQVLNSLGSVDAYLIKWDAAGQYVWAGRTGGGGFDEGDGVATDPFGGVVVAGYFTGPVDLDFDLPAGDHTLTNNGATDGFVLKLAQQSASGRVWADTDGDGLYDNGEAAVAGAVAELLDSDDKSLGTQVTGPAGTYLFIEPPASPTDGKYRVQFRAPPGLGFTAQDQGADFTRDSDAGVGGRTAKFSLNDSPFDNVGDALSSYHQDAGLTGAAPAFGFAAMAGGSSFEEGRAVTVDAAGNVYMAGFLSSTVDFDPSVGVYQLGAAGGHDAYVAKYTTAGALVWARVFGGASSDEAAAVAVDAAGNVYTTGVFSGAVNFDPAGAAAPLTGLGQNVFVSKLDQNGDYVWAKSWTGSGRGIAADSAGNVYTTGSFAAAGDFDPGAGTATLTPGTVGDAAFVSKLDQAGNYVWAKAMTGAGTAAGTGLALDGLGGVVTTGTFTGPVDFDPGAAAAMLMTAGGFSDAYVSKLDAAGNYVWAKQLGGAANDAGAAVAADAQGNVYTTGQFRGTADFDPGAGAAPLTSAGDADAYVSKLDAAGNYAWAKPLGGTDTDQGAGIALDAAGHVHTAGSFKSTADFDPGPGAAWRAAVGVNEDIYVSELDAAGAFVSAHSFGSGSKDTGEAVAVVGRGAVLVTGEYGGTMDVDPSAAAYPFTGVGQADAFLLKFAPATIGGVVWNDLNGNGARDLDDLPVAGAVAELLDSAGKSVSVQVTGADGAYSFPAPPDVSANAYTVQFRPPAGFGFTVAGVDSDAVQATGKTAAFPLAGNQAAVKDAGLVGVAPTFGFAAPAGDSGSDGGQAVATDAAGNVYVTGYFSASADFDPSPGVYTLTSAGGSDAYVAKYTPGGALVWAKGLGGVAQEIGAGVAVDANGSVYITGSFSGTADFDPSPGVYNLTSAGTDDAFVSKLDAAGNFLWARQLGGTGVDYASALAADDAGNVYTTGLFDGTADFDPGAGVYNLTTAGAGPLETYVSKLDAAGNFVWARRFGGDSGVSGNGVAVDSQGNVYTTGHFQGTADFDPGAGNFTLRGNGFVNAFVSKLDGAGNFVWARGMGGTANVIGYAVAVDAAGNVHTTGYFQETADFNPDPAVTLNLTSFGGLDVYVSKLDGDGNFVWVRQMGGPADDIGDGVAVDPQGNVLTTGSFVGAADFDPSNGAFTLTSAGNLDAFVSKLDAAGNFILARQVGAASSDSGSSVAVDGHGGVYTAGYFGGTVDFDPSAAVFNVTAAGANDAFVSKLILAGVSGVIWDDQDGDGVRDANEPGIIDATVELFDAVDGVVGNGDDNYLEAVTTRADGSYRFREPARGGNRYIRVNPPAGTAGANPAYAEVTTPGGDSAVDRFGRSALFDLSADPVQTFTAGLRPVSAPAPAWAIGSDGADAANGVAADAAGNTYVVGAFTGVTADADQGPGETSLMNNGDGAGYVAKYDAANQLLWARVMGGSGAGNAVQAAAVAVDAAGNVVVTGTFTGSADFGATPLTSLGGTDAFVAKLGAAGTFLWAKRYGGAGNDTGGAVAVDAANNIHATGTFLGNATIGGTAFTNATGSDAFVLKLNTADGSTAAARQIGGAGSVQVAGIAANSGGVYLAGSFAGTADFDPSATTFPLTSVGGSFEDAFVLKLTTGGSLAWAKQIGGGFADTANGLALDAAGNVLFTGGFQGTVDFDPSNNPFNLTSASALSDAYAAKFDAGGNFLWVKQFGGAGDDFGSAVTADARGYVDVAGAFAGAANFNAGASPMTSAGAADTFVVKLTSSGQFVLADRLGGVGADTPSAVAVYGAGAVTVVGSFEVTADLDFGFTPFLLAAGGATDGFVSHLHEFVIQGRAWIDADADGVQDPAESEVADATVELYDSVDGVIGNGDDTLVDSVTTTTGGYSFFEPADSYGNYVRIRLPQVHLSGDNLPTYLVTPPSQGNDPAADSDIDEFGLTRLVRRTQAATAYLGAGFQEAPLTAGGWGMGAGGADTGRAVATDAAGNVYTVGTFTGTVDFDPRPATTFLTSVGAADGYVAKYDPAGNLKWAKRLGGSAADAAVAVTIDAAGNVLVAGTFTGSADFGPTTLAGHAPGRDAFVLKMTAAGDFVWAKQLGGVKDETVAGVAADAAGNVFTTGTFAGTADFDPDAKKAANLTSTLKTSPANTPSRDLFLSKLALDGKYLWARKAGDATDETAAGVGVDALGRAFVSGNHDYFEHGGFVTQFDAAGAAGWTTSLLATRLSATVAAGDGVYAVGSHFVKLNADAGYIIAYRELTQYYRAVTVDAAGSVYATGYYDDGRDFDPGPGVFPLTPAVGGVWGAFVAKYDAAGAFVNAVSASGADPAVGNGVAVTADGTVFVTGSFQAAVDFDISPAAHPVTSAGGDDAFVWKIPAGGVTGRVWHDSDGDGLRDPTEPVGAGAVVTLYHSTNAVIGDGDDVVVGAQVTAADGSYRFAAPPAGPGYYVRVQPSVAPGLTFTGRSRGGNSAFDSDVDAQGASPLFAADAAVPTVIDAGTAGVYPLFGFAWTTGGPGESAVLANTADAAGNVYVTGEFKGAVDFDAGGGTVNLTSTGVSKNAFVAKYSPAGNLLWAKRFGGSDDIGGQGVAADAAGNVYVTGRFKGSADFGVGVPALAAAGYDAFVCRLDAAGNSVWAVRLGGAGDDYGNGVAAGAGRVVVTGSFKGTADFDPGAGAAELVSYGSQDAFVCALSADGARVWARRVGGAAGDDVGRGVVINAAGAVCVAGSFSGTADFDPGTVVLDQTSAGLRDAFAWKLDKDGNVAWATRAGGPADDDAAALAVDPAGRVAVAGTFAETADFDPGAGLLEVQSDGATDAFVWQLSAAGQSVWAKGLGGEAIDAGTGVAADATGVYVAGSFQQAADFDPGAGQIRLDSAGGSDAFVAKLDPAGNRQWAHRSGGASDDTARGAAVDSAGRVTFAGGLYGPGTFDAGDGDQVLPGGPAGNFFVGRVDQTPAGGAYPLDAFEPNNAAETATDLGVVNVRQVVTGLSVSSAHDADWFQLTLLSAGQAGDGVRIDVTPGHGDITLTLFRVGQGVPVGTVTVADGSATFAEISLDGMPAGAYRVRVTGAANPAYSLTLTTPAGFSPDAAEPNDAAGAATPLGLLADQTSVSRLSVNAPGDADWFSFVTLADGTQASEVRIDFRTAQGDLDLDLFDGAGKLIRSSAGASDVEAVSLAGLPAGPYLVRVAGNGAAINPAYTLTVRPPRPLTADAKEPNNTSAAATFLGELRGDAAWDGLSIDTAGDADWFKFVTVAAGEAGHAVAIDFTHAEGDLDLRLFNAAGVVQLAASTGNGDTESVSLQGLPAGTYYAKVSGFAGATQPAYRLRVAAPVGATPADRLEENGGNQTRKTASVVQTPGQSKLEGDQSLVDLTLNTVAGRADEDWFKFTTTGKGTAQHSVTLTSPAANGKLGLELYNAAGTKLAAGVGANGSLVASLKGRAAGTYYARAFLPKGGSAGSSYAITFDTPAAAVAPDDWTVMVYMTADSLTERAFNDVNEMETAVAGLPGSVNIAVQWDQSANLKTYPTGNGTQKAWGTVGRALVAPDTNPAAVATKFEILPEKDTGNPDTLKDFVAWAKKAAPAAHYALVFWDHGGGLRGFNFDTQDGQPADHLTPGEVVTALAGQPALDLIAFDACFMGVAETAYTLRDTAAVVVGSQDAVPGDGFEYDQAFSALATNPAGVTAEALATGLVQAFAARYRTTGYADTLAAVSTAKLGDLAAALQAVVTAVDTAPVGDPVAAEAAAEDRRRVVAIAASTLLPNAAAPEQRDLGGFLATLAADATLAPAIHTAAGSALAALDTAVVSRTADLRGHSGLSVYLPVTDVGGLSINPGMISDYGFQYPGFVSATAWPVMLTELRDAVDGRPDNKDSDELPANNNVLGAATDLRLLGSAGIVKSGLSLHDIDDKDWYAFQVNADAGASLAVDVRGPAALIAELRNAANQTLATAANGRLQLADLPAGAQTFYLYFHSAAVVNSYGFTVNPPVTAADQSGNNATPDKAYALPPDAGGSYAGFAVAADSQDWLRFDTTAQTSADLRRVTLTVAGGNPVEAQLRNAAGFVVSSASGTGVLVLPYTQSGGAESYTLALVNRNTAAVSYSLRLETATAADGGHPLDRFNLGDGTSLGSGTNWDVTETMTINGGAVVVGSAAGQALWKNFTAADVGVQANFLLPATGKPAASVLARATTGAGKLTAYEARLELYKGTLTAKLYRTVNGVASLVKFAAAPKVSQGVLRFEAQGQYLRILVNGNPCLEFTDTVVLAAGRTGFAGTTDVTLDDFQANALAAPLPVSFAAVAGGLGPTWQALAGQFTAQDGKFVSGPTAAAASFTPARLADAAVTAAYSVQEAGQFVGVFARDTGAAKRSYYEAQVSFTAGGPSAKLVRYINGAAKVLTPTPITAGVPATGALRLEVLGNELRLLVKPVTGPYVVLATVRDAGVPLAGRAGVSAAAAMSVGGFGVIPLGPRVADSFNRANSTFLGNGWDEKILGLSVFGNRLTGDGNGLAVVGPMLANVSVSALVDLSGGGQHTAGLVARYANNAYYEGRLTGNGDGTVTAVIYKVIGVVQTALKTLKLKSAAGTLRFDVEGASLKLSLLNETLSVTDSAVTAAGQAGVHLGAGDAIDDFTVR